MAWSKGGERTMEKDEKGESFQVKEKKFWILDTKDKSTVFQTMETATKTTASLIVNKIKEELKTEKDISKIFQTKIQPKDYSLQEIEITDEKYNIKPVSWFITMGLAMTLMGEKTK